MTRDELIQALIESENCELTENVLMSMNEAELREHINDHFESAHPVDTSAIGWPD